MFIANFIVVGGKASDEVSNLEGIVSVRRRLSLVLRAYQDTENVLSSGEELSSIDINFSLISGISSQQELSRKLESTDLGFLIHTSSHGDSPLIDGAVIWPTDQLPYYLLTASLNRQIKITINSLEMLLDWEDPYVWNSGWDAILRIEDYKIYCSEEHGN